MKKVGIVGLGNIARRHIGNLKELFPEVKIYGVPSSGKLNNKKLPQIDEYLLSVTDLVGEKPDFVVVASPATFHLQHCKQFIEAAIPVLVEKPVTADFKEALEFQALVESRQGIVAVGYCLRFMPALKKVKCIIENGELGSISHIEVNVGQYLPYWRQFTSYKDSVSASKNLGGGVLLELSHELDYIQYLFGGLQYEHGILRNSNELQLQVEEAADLMLSTESGIVCHVHMDFLQKCVRRQCVISGDSARLEWDLVSNKVVFYKNNKMITLYDLPEYDRNLMYMDMIRSFCEMVKGNQHSCATLQDASEVVELIGKIKESAKQGVNI